MALKYNVFLLDDDEEEELGKKNEELDMYMILDWKTDQKEDPAFTFNKKENAAPASPPVVGMRLS